MLNNWKERRRLKKELREFDAFYAPTFRAAQSEEDWRPVRKVYDQETAETTSALRRMSTETLKRRAKKWRVGLPEYDWDTPTTEAHWEENEYTGVRYLSDFGEDSLGKAISDAIFEWWKRWIGLLSPIASVTIALMAFLLAATALVLQVTGKIPRTIPPATTESRPTTR